MAIPDKVRYTKGEKTAEIVGGALLAVYVAVIITLMVMGITDGGNIIFLVVMLIEYGVFSICSVYPQGSNVLNKPETATDRDFHRVRRGSIIAKYVMSTAVFLLSLPFFG